MFEDLNPVWIDSPEEVDDVVRAVREARLMALDTEADSLHSYFHKVCLIQVTADGRNFVIDPLAIQAEVLAPLWASVEDPELPVLMHGADYDIRVLDRDYEVRIRGLQDTQSMAQLLGEPKTGLAALLEQEGGVILDKRHQRADWGRRPLTRSQVNYAAADTAFLERLTGCLRERLEELGRWEWAVDEFRRLEEVRHQPPEPDPLAFERIKGVRGLRGKARDRAFTLFEWRESEAQRLDVPPFKVLGAKPLLALADEPPKKKNLLAEVEGIGPRFVRRWGEQIMAVIAGPDHAPERGKNRREPVPPAAVIRRAKSLAAARDQVVAALGLDPGLVCPRACVLAVAALEPRGSDVGDLEAAGLTGWRLEILGESFLEVMAESSNPTRH